MKLETSTTYPNDTCYNLSRLHLGSPYECIIAQIFVQWPYICAFAICG